MRIDKPTSRTPETRPAAKPAVRKEQKRTGRLFREGQGENAAILEGHHKNRAELLRSVKTALHRNGQRFSTRALAKLISDRDGDGYYEINTDPLGKGAYLYLRRQLDMHQYVDANATTAATVRQVKQLRAALQTEVASILQQPIQPLTRDSVVRALSTLRTEGQYERYATLKQDYMDAHFAHIGGNGDVVESFRSSHVSVLPTIYSEHGLTPPVVVGDCNALATLSRELDRDAGARSTHAFSVTMVDDAKPGASINHQLARSQLGRHHYVLSNNTAQILIPPALVRKHGIARATRIMSIGLIPQQVRKNGAALMSTTQMQRFIDQHDESLQDVSSDLRQGFAVAYALRFQRTLVAAPLRPATLHTTLEQAKDLHATYNMDASSKAYLQRHLKKLISTATRRMQTSPTEAATQWAASQALLQQLGFTPNETRNIRHNFIEAHTKTFRNRAKTAKTHKQYVAFLQEATRNLEALRDTLDPDTWQALTKNIHSKVLSRLPFILDTSDPTQISATVRALKHSCSLLPGEKAHQSLRFQLYRMADALKHTTYNTRSNRYSDPEKLHEVSATLNATVAELGNSDLGTRLREQFFFLVARESYTHRYLDHMNHWSHNADFQAKAAAVTAAMQEFPGLIPTIKADIINRVTMRSDPATRAVEIRSYKTTFPQFADDIQRAVLAYDKQ